MEAVRLLSSCSHGVAQLLSLVRNLQLLAATSHRAANAAPVADAAPTVVRAGNEELVGEYVERFHRRGSNSEDLRSRAPMLLDDVIRAVRRSKAILDGQHDTLCQLLLWRVERGK